MPDTKQTITDFYRVAQERDFSRDFHFRVLSITAGDSAGISFTEDDLVYVRTATLPGRTIQNKNVSYMGMNFNIPGSVTYDGSSGWALEFYSDQAARLRGMFESWSFDIFDDSTSTGNYNTPSQNSVINLLQLDAQLEAVAEYTLYGCYLTSLGDISYQPSAGSGEPQTFNATMAFQYWRREKSSAKGLFRNVGGAIVDKILGALGI
jgi:hypothetical protein